MSMRATVLTVLGVGDMIKRVAMVVLVLLVFPLIGQGFEECGPLGCEHEIRELKRRVQELEWEDRWGERDEEVAAGVREMMRERSQRPKTEAEVEEQRREYNLYWWERGH